MNPFGKLKLVMRLQKMVGLYWRQGLHAAENNETLMTHDLGKALRRLKRTVQDPDMGLAETAYEAAPLFAEVQILKFLVAKKMRINTKEQTFLQVLNAISAHVDQQGSKANKELKEVLDWANDFFSQPQVKEIVDTELTEINKPKNWKDVKGAFNTVTTSIKNISDRVSRMNDVLQKAKEEPPQNNNPGPSPAPAA